MLTVNFFFALLGLFTALILLLFILSRDGALRKLLIIREAALTWGCLVMALRCPFPSQDEWFYYTLIVIVPMSIATMLLSVYLAKDFIVGKIAKYRERHSNQD